MNSCKACGNEKIMVCPCCSGEWGENEMDTLRARVAELESALGKINDIRNSIVGSQTVNWSEHVYPLVSALQNVGIDGLPYPESRSRIGSLIERAAKAESRVAELETDRDRWKAEALATRDLLSDYIDAQSWHGDYPNARAANEGRTHG